LQVKQLISHGHIHVNGNKVKSPTTQIRLGDRIQIKGFIARLNSGLASQSFPQSMQTNHLFTLLLRRFKDKTYLNSLGGVFPGASSPSTESEELLYDYIGGLKIKRFTEAFYMTYKNLHLIERHAGPLLSAPAHSSDLADQAFDVEKHIQPVFDTIGYNQSIYLLWPLTSLLKICS